MLLFVPTFGGVLVVVVFVAVVGFVEVLGFAGGGAGVDDFCVPVFPLDLLLLELDVLFPVLAGFDGVGVDLAPLLRPTLPLAT